MVRVIEAVLLDEFVQPLFQLSAPARLGALAPHANKNTTSPAGREAVDRTILLFSFGDKICC